MLFAYNQERYVREAVIAALAQDCAPIEIILSDDGSTDRTFDIIRSISAGYEGPHTVRINRNSKNLGLTAHVNKLFEMASGDIFVLAGGDDVSLPSRVRDTVSAFERHPEVAMVSFIDEIIDEEGKVALPRGESNRERVCSLEEFLAIGPLAQRKMQLSAASRAILRSVFDSFGILIPECPAEDTPLILRSLYVGSGLVCHWSAIQYRRHDRQLSNEGSIARMDFRKFTAQYLQDLGVAVKMGKVDAGHERKVKCWIEESELFFDLRQIEFQCDRPSARILRTSFRSRHMSLREKIGVLKRFVVRSSQWAPLRRCNAHLIDLVSSPLEYLSRIVRSPNSTDIERWSRATSFDEGWDSRTQLIARLIQSGDRVAEFGAGMQALRDTLPKGCSYQPFDLVARTSETRVCNLNQGFPNNVDSCNVAVFSGVLEYLHELGAVFQWLGKNFERVIFSYAVSDRLASPLLRSQHGWVNNLSRSELIDLARAKGFSCRVVGTWRDHFIFVAERP